jgi:hypothetical protein
MLFLAVTGNILFTTASRLAVRPTQHLVQCARLAVPSAVKRSQPETVQPPPLVPNFKNGWRYTSIPPHVVYGVVFN